MAGPTMKGPSLVKLHPLYRRWSFMRQVCNNPRHVDYKSYGAKGVKVGKEFAEFWNFVDIIEKKLGPPPFGSLSKLARKDQDGDYTIKNLCWDQAAGVGRRHKRSYKLKYKGKTRPLREWSAETGINFATMASRVERGWTPQQVLGLRPGPRASIKQ